MTNFEKYVAKKSRNEMSIDERWTEALELLEKDSFPFVKLFREVIKPKLDGADVFGPSTILHELVQYMLQLRFEDAGANTGLPVYPAHELLDMVDSYLPEADQFFDHSGPPGPLSPKDDD